MNNFIKTWTTALRSGNFQQAKKILRSQDGMRFDCMGVLVETMRALQPEDTRWAWQASSTPDNPKYGLTRICKDLEGNDEVVWSYHLLPVNLLHEVGLTTLDQYHLQMLNDQGVNFVSIANYIDREILNRS